MLERAKKRRKQSKDAREWALHNRFVIFLEEKILREVEGDII